MATFHPNLSCRVAAVLAMMGGLAPVAAQEYLPPGFRLTEVFPNTTFRHPNPPDPTRASPPSVVTLEQLPDGRVFIGTGDARGFFWDYHQYVATGTATLGPVLFDYLGWSTGEMGTAGCVAAPDYLESGHFFVSYTYDPHPWDWRERRIRVERFTADLENPTAIVPGSGVLIYDIPDVGGSDYHFSLSLEIGPDDKLYMSLGDDATPSVVQGLTSPRGKILRMNLDGSAPADNPFFQAGNTTARNLIYALGLRNPFRLHYDRGRGIFYSTDVGQSLWEELNVVGRGYNFGWPLMEGPLSDNPGVTPPANYHDPVYAYPHGAEDLGGVSIVGIAPYYGDMFPAEYHGDLFHTDWGNPSRNGAGGKIIRLRRDAEGNILGPELFYRMERNVFGTSDLITLDDGSLLMATTFNTNGRVYRITYSTPDNPPQVAITTSVTTGTMPLAVSFGAEVVDEGTPTLLWEFGDGTTSTTRNPSKTYNSPGVYTVRLTARDAFNSVATATQRIEVYRSSGALELEFTVADVSGGTPSAVPATVRFLQPDGVSPLLLAGGGRVDPVEVAPGTIGRIAVGPGLVAGGAVIAEFQSPGLVARRLGLAAPQAGELWVGNVSLARTAVLPTITRSDTGAAQPEMDIWIGRVGPFGDVVPYGVPDGITIPGRTSAGLLSDALGGVYFPIPDADAGAIFEVEANLQERLASFQVVAVDVTTSPTVASAVPMLLQQITGGTGCDELTPPDWYSPDFSVVQGLFNIHCVGCHGHVRPYMGLNLEEGFAFSSLVNRRSREVPSLYLVEERAPGFAASDNQYLLEKITCDAPSIGGVMPPAGKITGQERRDIAQWIRNGSKPSAAPPRRTTLWADTTEGLSPARVQFRGGADAAQPPFTFEWDFGDGTAPVITDDPQRTFVVLEGTAVYTTRVTARNRAGQVVGTASWSLSVSAPEPTPGNTAPTARLAARDVTTAGVPFILSAAGTTDADGQVMAYLWDLDADGQWDDSTTTPERPHTITRGGGHRVRVGAVDNHNAVGIAEVIVVLPVEIDGEGMLVY